MATQKRKGGGAGRRKPAAPKGRTPARRAKPAKPAPAKRAKAPGRGTTAAGRAVAAAAAGPAGTGDMTSVILDVAVDTGSLKARDGFLFDDGARYESDLLHGATAADFLRKLANKIAAALDAGDPTFKA